MDSNGLGGAIEAPHQVFQSRCDVHASRIFFEHPGDGDQLFILEWHESARILLCRIFSQIRISGNVESDAETLFKDMLKRLSVGAATGDKANDGVV